MEKLAKVHTNLCKVDKRCIIYPEYSPTKKRRAIFLWNIARREKAHIERTKVAYLPLLRRIRRPISPASPSPNSVIVAGSGTVL